ncbi:type II toxin-antitoxin system RelE/ParE family toxin [Pectobacterium versatile]|uniref:type II toxin-antitoxin system RelE/ParE family toxin n=1 Tax=Pectobacterium versatile TaxID=2488639 RepID=UPI000CDECA2D|nr:MULTISPECIES: type II toxin-antitoxin system RelE/ParE family toxin [Pectobacterium]MCA6927745.1 type II toxin-antitoxin system RelE/ParE family toxin [Pectobacterium versatile]MCH5084491.1 type II toxin-antitoxin system RelE/ParE family toxin [Pectobacterium versatile]MCL6371359.1 diaminopimelate decarboxylase [Pectobacterium atrosepticum]POY58919.1 diaminopimelate decarboxylase [Pectobacterium versatile]POY62098.1 diaminopimelate decarboxylase [Pectobacterium versatile]
MWRIETTDVFDGWFSALNDRDRACVLAALIVLREKGPMLSRPYADMVKGSRYSNMKELRIQSGGTPIRAFFAFDPHRTGILLCAGNKSGNEKRFYDEMLPFAERELTNYLKKSEKRE